MAFGYADVRLDFITRASDTEKEARRFDEWFAREIDEAQALASRKTERKALADFTRLVDSLDDVPVAVRNRVALAVGEFARDRSL